MNKALSTVALLSLPLAVCAIGCSPEGHAQRAPDMERALALREVFESGAGGGAGGPVLPDPTGWGTIKGSFSMTGSPPAAERQPIGKDTNVCGNVSVQPKAVVKNGKLAGVVIYLVTKIETDDASPNPKWVHPDYAAERNATIKFDQEKCIFLTHVDAIRTSQTLAVYNSDPIGHNTSVGKFNQLIPAGPDAVMYKWEEAKEVDGKASPSDQFRQPQAVSCTIHPWMRAYLLVRDDPYFAVTDENGQFEMANVPAGVPLEFAVWQESARFIKNAKVNGQEQTFSRGRFQVTLEPDKTVDMQVEVDASLFQ